MNKTDSSNNKILVDHFDIEQSLVREDYSNNNKYKSQTREDILHHLYKHISKVMLLLLSICTSLLDEFLQPSLLMSLRSGILQSSLLTSLQSNFY